MVAHFVCLLFTGFMVYTAKPGSSLFSWHPTLMSVAFMFLMAEAVLVFSPHSSFVHTAARKVKATYHWTAMAAALVCALGGTFSIWYNKELNNSPHMVSWHGLIGYITMAYILCQNMAGSGLLYPQFMSKYVKISQLKIMHATSGMCLFSLVATSLMLGMNSGWFRGQVTGTSWYACMACPALMLLVVANQVVRSVMTRPGVRL